jgi:hypothetical protein
MHKLQVEVPAAEFQRANHLRERPTFRVWRTIKIARQVVCERIALRYRVDNPDAFVRVVRT